MRKAGTPEELAGSLALSAYKPPFGDELQRARSEDGRMSVGLAPVGGRHDGYDDACAGHKRMNEATMFSILFASVGLLFAGIGIPLILGKVPPNSFYGCRTTKTLSDPKIWYAANRMSGKDFLISGLLILIASLTMLAFGRGLNPDHVVVTLLSVLLLSVAVAAWHCFTAVRRM